MTRISLMATAVFCLPVAVIVADEVSPEVRAGIQATLEAQVAAWNSGDIPGFMDGYVRSDELRFASGGSVQRGWDNTLARYLNRYSSPELMGRLVFSDIEILQLAPDAAEVFGSWHLTRQGDVGDIRGLFTLLMKKINGRWLVLHDHTSAADAAVPSDQTRSVGLSPEATALLARIAAELDQRAAAAADFDRTAGPSAATLSSHGDLMMFFGRFEDAVTDYQAMIPLDPSLEQSHWRLGIALYYADQPKEAAAVFDRYHSFDQVDRENGIWRFLCHHRAYGPEPARRELLKYQKDDREPFPAVYRMFDGTTTADEVLAALPDDLSADARNQRLFYIHLYAGLLASVNQQRTAAITSLEQALLNPWPQSAGFGPRYMWQVGRLQLLQLLDPVPAPDNHVPVRPAPPTSN